MHHTNYLSNNYVPLKAFFVKKLHFANYVYFVLNNNVSPSIASCGITRYDISVSNVGIGFY